MSVSSGVSSFAVLSIGMSALQSPLGKMVKTNESTQYQVNEKTGTIAVLRRTTEANGVGKNNTSESFLLDRNTGLMRDYERASRFKTHI